MKTRLTSMMKKVGRSFLHLIMMVIFMMVADHMMRANLDRGSLWLVYAVNLGGAVVYLCLVWFARWLRRHYSL